VRVTTVKLLTPGYSDTDQSQCDFRSISVLHWPLARWLPPQ